MLPVWIAPFLLLSAADPPDPRVLLEEAGERLRRMEGFSLRVEQRSYNPGRNMKTTQYQVDRGPGGRVRIDSDGSRPLLVFDGKTYWRYDRNLNSYAAELDPEGRVAETIRYTMRRFVERVDLLRLHAGVVRFVKWEEARSGRKGQSCAVLEMLSADRGGQWLARAWVDPQEKLLLRLDMERIDGVTEYGEMRKRGHDAKRSGFLSRAVQENHLYWKSLAASSESVFVFEPPPKAQRASPPPVPSAESEPGEPPPPEQ